MAYARTHNGGHGAEWKSRNRLRANAQARALYDRDAQAEREQRYRKTNAAALRAKARARYARDSRPVLARRAVYLALKRGAITRGPCEVGRGCQGGIEAHHDDYDKPLDVRWLCQRHHAELRRREKA